MRVKERKLELLKLARKNQANMFKYHNQSQKITLDIQSLQSISCNVKPFLDDEIMKQVIIIFTKNGCFTNIQLKAKQIQLSNDTVTRCAKCISNDQHKERFQQSRNFVTKLSHLTSQMTLPIQSI